jgi:MoaA/NifB/PqqE/SkfB family radical SAM enzyme
VNGRDPLSTVWDWFHGGRPGPLVVWFNPTMACNLNCLFCRRQDDLPGFYARHKEIPDDRYVEAVRDAVEMGARFVGFKGGGEPLIRRRLFARLIPLVKGGRETEANLITNGTLLDDTLAELFVRHGWDQITVSLDSPHADTHDELRSKAGVFARATEAVRRLNRFKKSSGLAKPEIRFHTVLTNRVHRDVGDLVRLAASLGVGAIELDSLSADKPSGVPLTLAPAQLAEFEAALPGYVRLADELGIKHNLRDFATARYAVRGAETPVPPPLPAAAPSAAASPGTRAYYDLPCYMPWFFVSVTPAGAMSPCCYGEGEGDCSRATLHTETFRDAWEHAIMGEFRESMTSGRMRGFCRSCTAHYIDQNARMRGELSLMAVSEREKTDGTRPEKVVVGRLQ